jgi:glutathione S-transferase
LEPLLSQQAFLCADRFTAADVSVGYALLLAQHLGLDQEFTSSVHAYWERLQARPAYQSAMKAQNGAAISQGVPTIASPDIRPA